MIGLTIDLPPKYRLQFKVTKRRKTLDSKPFMPSLGEILRVKKGSKISRYFRFIFENRKIKKLLGANLAVLTLTSSLITPTVQANKIATDQSTEEVITTSAPVVLTTNQSFRYPTENIRITTRFSFFHPGIDLDGITGDAIQPIFSGFVETIEISKVGYGKSIIVNHRNGYLSRYAHLSKISVKQGEEVTSSTKLGEMGATGRAFGDHLHLEIYKDGKAINPLTLLH